MHIGKRVTSALQVFALLFSVIIAILRCYGVKSEFYQAIVHLWVGGLFVAGFLGYSWCMHQAIVLTIVEVICFTIGALIHDSMF